MKIDRRILRSRLLSLGDEMLSLADSGERAAQDDGCLILYGILKDQAYFIRRQAAEIKTDRNTREEK